MGNAFEILGMAAGAFTTFAFLPQLVQTFRTRQVRDLNLGSLVAFDIGLALWLVYGIYKDSWPIISANVVTLLLQLGILFLKLRYNHTGASTGEE